MDLSDVLKAPVVTEKSTKAQESRKYTFRVDANANKVEIANAVNRAYGVDVISVNILPVLGKARLAGRGRTITKRPKSKKAIVTVKAKQTLDFNKVKTAK